MPQSIKKTQLKHLPSAVTTASKHPKANMYRGVPVRVVWCTKCTVTSWQHSGYTDHRTVRKHANKTSSHQFVTVFIVFVSGNRLSDNDTLGLKQEHVSSRDVLRLLFRTHVKNLYDPSRTRQVSQRQSPPKGNMFSIADWMEEAFGAKKQTFRLIESGLGSQSPTRDKPIRTAFLVSSYTPPPTTGPSRHPRIHGHNLLTIIYAHRLPSFQSTDLERTRHVIFRLLLSNYCPNRRKLLPNIIMRYSTPDNVQYLQTE